jgi:hypothetical protein
MGNYYDLERAIQESGLPSRIVDDILNEVRTEFPDDEMMYELHVVRALEGELRLRMPSEAWRQRQIDRADRFLDEGDMERVLTPPDRVPRIRRRAQGPQSSSGVS